NFYDLNLTEFTLAYYFFRFLYSPLIWPGQSPQASSLIYAIAAEATLICAQSFH
ncbi:hypothetical protein PSYMO_34052, partial [Pseudomonas amygdali pv. mori str. 301020]